MYLISFCLYGSAPKYVQGALANIRLAPEVYPGWRVRVYCEDRTPAEPLEAAGAQVVRMGKSRRHEGMLWRFLPAWEPGVKAAIFRDCDSRLNPREAAAVNAWLRSSYGIHCMHDHEHHASFPLFGGMWGARHGALTQEMHQSLQDLLRRRVRRVGDMIWLRRVVYPATKYDTLRHSSVDVSPWGPYSDFPEHPEWPGFVGEQVEA